VKTGGCCLGGVELKIEIEVFVHEFVELGGDVRCWVIRGNTANRSESDAAQNRARKRQSDFEFGHVIS
jgi:hypothetical protein